MGARYVAEGQRCALGHFPIIPEYEMSSVVARGSWLFVSWFLWVQCSQKWPPSGVGWLGSSFISPILGRNFLPGKPTPAELLVIVPRISAAIRGGEAKNRGGRDGRPLEGLWRGALHHPLGNRNQPPKGEIHVQAILWWVEHDSR